MEVVDVFELYGFQPRLFDIVAMELVEYDGGYR